MSNKIAMKSENKYDTKENQRN